MEIAAVRASLVLYETGPRLGEALAALAEGLGAREAVVARELTKRGLAAVTFDFLNSGESDGSFDQALVTQEVADAAAEAAQRARDAATRATA